MAQPCFSPFGSSQKIPEYRNPKNQGTVADYRSAFRTRQALEMRQLPVHVLLTNHGERAVELLFPTEQRIEILLHDSTGRVVTRWSETALSPKSPQRF
jgi:hypothetical protein